MSQRLHRVSLEIPTELHFAIKLYTELNEVNIKQYFMDLAAKDLANTEYSEEAAKLVENIDESDLADFARYAELIVEHVNELSRENAK